MPTELLPAILPFSLEVKTAKTGAFYVIATAPNGRRWGLWVFFKDKGEAEGMMYEVELGRVGRTWKGPVNNPKWKEITPVGKNYQLKNWDSDPYLDNHAQIR